ncbi:hypothetical protein VTL71DRAFT_15033 [Oculimacula yallundae]|uniref:Uncharacterized protein n=1 Tax=Oculimacula yallundae TaxID=86028 RepID=A0ABR4CG01_9HELO
MDAVALQDMAIKLSDAPALSRSAQHNEDFACNIHGIHVFRSGSKDHDLIKTSNFSQDNLKLQTAANEGALTRYLRQVVTRQSIRLPSRENSLVGSNLGILVCLLETQDSSSMAMYLSTEFKDFPESIRRYMSGHNAFSNGSWATPVWHDSERLSYVQNYLMAHKTLESFEPEIASPSSALGQQTVRSTSIAVWTGGSLEITNRASSP